VATLAAESTISLHGIPLWLRAQMKVKDWESDEQVVMRVFIREAIEMRGVDIANGCQGS